MMYDVCIIGSGWAGINAAIIAARNGLSVALIEKDVLGGTCLNYGCIPTKAFITSASHLCEVKHLADFGIEVESVKLNFTKVLGRKDKLVACLRQGLEGLIKTKKINLISGEARIINTTQLSVRNQTVAARNIIIASGSRPRGLPNLKFDGKRILSSSDLLQLETIPGNLLIIGGGVIGCEFAGIYSELGSKVTMVEILERLLITEDREVSKKMEIAFKKQGVKVFTGTDFSTLSLDEFDKILLCVGRSANIEDLGLGHVGINTDKGKICVDEYLRTNIANIYAVGDCIGGYQLAHVASYEGRIAAENILGKNKKVDYSAVPNCIFTRPEIASVGITEEEARKRSYNIKVARFNFLGLGMAHVKGKTDGFIKLVAETKSEQILGVVIFGLGATELISTLTLAIRNKLNISAVYETIFPHPTLSESISEAAHNFYAV